MISALSRRIFIFLAANLLVAFVILFLHDLQADQGFPVAILVAGGATCAGVILLNWWRMFKTDDYLTPVHARIFFSTIAVLSSLIGLGLLAFFFFQRDNYAQSIFVYYGVLPAGIALITVILSIVRYKEAFAMPQEYRTGAETESAMPTLATSLFSFLIVGASVVSVSIMISSAPMWEVREHQWDEEADEEMALGDDVRHAQAVEYYELAMEQRENYRRSYDFFRRAADYGHLEALFEVANIYAGDGYLKDYPRAVETYEKAAERGHEESALIIGRAYRRGEMGLDPDPEKARHYLEKAAEGGSMEAQNQLANIYARGEGIEADPETAFYWFKRAAEQGSGTAQNDVGIHLVNGTGVEANIEEGIYWLEKAADQNIPVAQYNLAHTLYYGEVAERDYELSFKYFSRLAQQDIAIGHRYVGLHYWNGQGVEQDEEKAMEAFTKAARFGDQIAEYYVGQSYLHGRGATRDTSRAILFLERAAQKHNPEAQYLLGTIYRDGHVTLQDPLEAAKWFYLAAENGDERAASEWEKIQDNLSSSDLQMLEGSISSFQELANR